MGTSTQPRQDTSLWEASVNKGRTEWVSIERLAEWIVDSDSTERAAPVSMQALVEKDPRETGIEIKLGEDTEAEGGWSPWQGSEDKSRETGFFVEWDGTSECDPVDGNSNKQSLDKKGKRETEGEEVRKTQ